MLTTNLLCIKIKNIGEALFYVYHVGMFLNFIFFSNLSFCEEVSDMEVHKFRIGDVEFEVSGAIEFIGRVRIRGGSFYILVPKRVAEANDLKNDDVVSVTMVKIKNIRLLPKKEVEANEE